jgi:hypothetical protein
VAMVTGDGRRFKNALEMAEVTAELKEYAKSLAGNNFVKERRLGLRPSGTETDQTEPTGKA